jgi:hypothetical protein
VGFQAMAGSAVVSVAFVLVVARRIHCVAVALTIGSFVETIRSISGPLWSSSGALEIFLADGAVKPRHLCPVF